ncbi:hypothetical protein [uncultured Campylobacter sp.]|uniref:hypothetical protein n=1 Tax=uncultured Campylobacter sp. TaxID=218934 RepID=UPI0025E4E94E|nr:hypothetical protein [uncultured Campylobacter sp.]
MKLRLRGVVAWDFFASCARAMWQRDQGRSKNSDICGAGGCKILRRKCGKILKFRSCSAVEF